MLSTRRTDVKRQRENEGPTKAEITALKQHFDWILDPLRRFRRNPSRAIEQPATFMETVREQTRARIDREVRVLGRDAFVRARLGANLPRRVIVDGLARMPDFLCKEERRIARLPGGRGHLALLLAADDRVANSPLLVSLNVRFLLGFDALSSSREYHQALRARGERRALGFARGVADVAEGL